MPGPVEANRRLSRRRMAGHVVARQGQPRATAMGSADLLVFGQQQQRMDVGKMFWEPPASTVAKGNIESGMTSAI